MSTCSKANCDNVSYTICDICQKQYCLRHIREIIIRGQPSCGYYMYAEREDYQEQGSWVNYVCRNQSCSKCKGKCNMTEKVFEPKK
jgi:hypothetical protein